MHFLLALYAFYYWSIFMLLLNLITEPLMSILGHATGHKFGLEREQALNFQPWVQESFGGDLINVVFWPISGPPGSKAIPVLLWNQEDTWEGGPWCWEAALWRQSRSTQLTDTVPPLDSTTIHMVDQRLKSSAHSDLSKSLVVGWGFLSHGAALRCFKALLRMFGYPWSPTVLRFTRKFG